MMIGAKLAAVVTNIFVPSSKLEPRSPTPSLVVVLFKGKEKQDWPYGFCSFTLYPGTD